MYLGGGTNLVDLMKLGVETPERLVDVSRLPHDAIEELPGGGLRIGAAVRNSDLAVHPVVRERYPVLSQALLAGASGQLRNLATVGGNLLQRTRCSYFQDVTKPCNKRRPGSGCPAREGEHRNLAILGHSEHCVATHPSDMAVALTALSATVHVHGTAGARTLSMPGFHRLPGDEPQRDTNLEPGDLITAIELRRRRRAAANSTYRKVRERASFSFAVISVAAAISERDGVVEECRIALGGVAHVPWRATEAEAALRGKPRHAGELRGRRRRRTGPSGAAARQRLQGPAHAQRPRQHPQRAVRMSLEIAPAVGAPLSRVEGREKVMGQAQYAYEQPIEGVAYAVAVASTIAAGEIVRIDAAEARAVDGVLAVISHENAPRLAEVADGELRILQSASVAYRGQIVAAVVAESLEAAQEAAAAVRIEYAPGAHDVELRPGHPRFYKPEKVNPSFPTDVAHGDLDAGLDAADVVVDATYTTQPIHNNPMEPHASLAVWERRRPHAVRLDPGHLVGAQRHRRAVRARARARAGDLPPRRRRLRLEGHAAAAGRARRDRRQADRAPGQGRADPSAAVLDGRLPHADDPARAARRRARRPATGDRPRRLRADLDRARVRRADHARHAPHVRGARPAHHAPAGRPRRADAVVDARARRVPGHVRARVRDRRARDRVRHRPDRAADRQRARRGPREGHPVQLAQPRRLPARGRAALRLGRNETRLPARVATAAGSSAPASPRRPTRSTARPRRRPRGSTPTATSPSRSPRRTSAPARGRC